MELHLPPLDRVALLLDMDGTLLDLAPTPDAVVVPPELPEVLLRLRRLTGDAVAVVTGRPVETVERLFGDSVYAVAGEHGGAIRDAPGRPAVRPPLPPPPERWFTTAANLAASHSGLLFERKARGFAVHYRAIPDAAQMVRDVLAGLLVDSTEFELLPAHMLWEVRPRGTDKGKAVAYLMERAPFLGRLPVFVGDDVTDEDGIAMAAKMGGAGLRVQETFGDPAGVRAWLQATATRGQWPCASATSPP